jgi:hypothetical protein
MAVKILGWKQPGLSIQNKMLSSIVQADWLKVMPFFLAAFVV